MRKLPALAFMGLAAAAAAGAAIAAPKTHVINVPLADGSTVRVEYAGDVPPKVTIAPVRAPAPWTSAVPAFPDLRGIFDQISAQMRQIEQAVPLGAPGMNVAAYGSLPAGARSVSVVTTSNGAATCTRTTEVVSQGPDKAPKVTSSLSGNCAAGAAPPPAPPAPPPTKLDRT